MIWNSASGVYDFQLVAELEYPIYPESYANGSLATDRASHVGQVKEKGADKELLQKRISMGKEIFGTVLLAEEDPLNGM